MREKSELSSLTVTSADDWIANYSDEEVRELFMLRSSTAIKSTHQAAASTGNQKQGRLKRLLSENTDETPPANDNGATASSTAKKPRPAWPSLTVPVSATSS